MFNFITVAYQLYVDLEHDVPFETKSFEKEAKGIWSYNTPRALDNLKFGQFYNNAQC